MNNKTEIKNFKDEATNKVVNKARETAETVKEEGKGLVSNFLNKRNIQELAKEAGENTRVYLEEKQEQLSEVKHKAENTIREYPIVSTIAAFVGGALLTSLFRRK